MALITFLPDQQKVESSEAETLLEVAQRADIPITHVCQGNGRCSTCRVQIIEGQENVSPPSDSEKLIAVQMGFGETIRLACQAKIIGDITIRRLVLDEEDIEVTSLLIQDAKSSLVGAEKEVLILFADIRNFTSLAEALLPYDVIHFLNRYFHAMNKVITSFGGNINNYMGDGFLALFDIENAQHDVLRGIMAGLEMLRVVETKILPYVKSLFGKDLRIGIGMHRGMVVAGSLGDSPNKKNTIIGDAVNVTSRIEKSNKDLNTSFLISEDVHTVVKKKILTGKSQMITLRGKTGSHMVYEVLGLKEEV